MNSFLLPICWIMLLILSAAGVIIASRHLRGAASTGAIRRLDLQAFATLLDPGDEIFLRKRLSHSAFIHLKRKRLRVAFLYLNRLSANMAAVLRIRNTEWVLASGNAQFSAAAVMAVDLANEIRLQCLIAYAQLSLEFLFPTHQFTALALIGEYRSLKEILAQMQRIATDSHLAPVPII
jgi:hypothetical protein